MRCFLYVLIFLCFLVGKTDGQTIEIPFSGDYADPTIVRVGKDFYMTHTSHAYYPGLLVWHSTDLKAWVPVGRALHSMVGTVWAPELVYHKNKYYIYFPTDKGGNYVIMADSPCGEWSDPVRLDVEGIDPGHVADSEGKRYLYVNGGRMVSLSDDGLVALTKEKQVYDGWVYPADWAVECFCLESPKLIFHDGYYYMISAEGGTSGPSTSHMAVVARSKSVAGPWENSPYNPLIHTYDPRDSWVSKGHATLFDDVKGNWYITYHAYGSEKRPQGRATLIEPVQWTSDGWPVIKRGKFVEADMYIVHPNTKLQSDDFSSSKLNWQWCFWGLDSLDDYSLDKGCLTIKGSEGKMKALMAIASEDDYEVTAEIETSGDVETGLALFYNDIQFVGIGLKNDEVYGLWQGKSSWSRCEAKGCKFLRLTVRKYTVSLAYSADGKNWVTYPHGFDVSGYHTNMFGGFLSLKPSVLCKGNGVVTVCRVSFLNK